jgi:hypothetical protein
MIAISERRILGLLPDETVSETGMDPRGPFHAECPTWSSACGSAGSQTSFKTPPHKLL